MTRVLLEGMLRETQFADLPPAWNTLDLGTFSATKSLWDYQRRAVEQGVKALEKYYQEFSDYRPDQTEQANESRRRQLARWYGNNGLRDQDITRPRSQRLARLLEEYYPGQAPIPFEGVCNRACFWMATGSGKTLVLVKLIEALRYLIRRREIPPNDILVLSSRDDLLVQLQRHIAEFNAAHGDLEIRLVELRQYAEAKRVRPNLFGERDLTVFYYRSDNLSDEQKERIVDFRNYDNHGRWYVLLDEAHKGDREDSKRQHIYSILSRNGFLFSFSATFTDARDIATTACNFNLSRFIGEGYGKHIGILKQELRAFRDDEDYTGDEKQKIVLKSLIMLTYARDALAGVRAELPEAYHRPLLLTLVNSVNTQDADLELFFRQLERVCRGDVPEHVWAGAKLELWQELQDEPAFMFDTERMRMDADRFQGLSQGRLLQAVFNSEAPGEIEVLVRPSNRKEIALKAKPADRPFALIRIGDISPWLKEKLTGYEVIEGYEDEGFFERLNDDDSDVNVLMGSRSFYEGWDSNRPNVINFINIGVGQDARKFILQAVGRGVRIEPIRHERKRLDSLANAGRVSPELHARISSRVRPLEALLVFGTNRKALETVIGELEQQQDTRAYVQLSLFPAADAERRELLIPVYEESGTRIVDSGDGARFAICEDELIRLRDYVARADDDRVLMARHGADPAMIRVLHRALAEPATYFRTDTSRKYGLTELLLRRALDYFSVVAHECRGLKPLTNEIVHFEQIAVARDVAEDLKQKVQRVAEYRERPAKERQLRLALDQGRISLDEYTTGIQEAATMVKEDELRYHSDGGHQTINVRYVANHYYFPILVAEDARPELIQHAIRTASEARFIEDLDRYVSRPDNGFAVFDWWMFSKLDESLDRVYIPYYDGSSNSVREFRPDFVFWFRKGTDYTIAFVDPKGTAHSEYELKMDGYRRLFEGGGERPRPFTHNGLTVRVYAYLYSPGGEGVGASYRRHWITEARSLLAGIAAPM